MANLHRGEIDAVFDGRRTTLCLTLGALAELESAFGDADMLALAERFGQGRLKASEAVRIIGAGLRGAGHDISDGDVARLQAEGGAAGFVAVVGRLLQATFGAPSIPHDQQPQASSSPEGRRAIAFDDPPPPCAEGPGVRGAAQRCRTVGHPTPDPSPSRGGEKSSVICDSPAEVGPPAPFPGTT